jgi:hypothetical protein
MREPANAAALDEQLETARASDAEAEAKQAPPPLSDPTPAEQPGFDPARYRRSLGRVATPLLLGVSIAIGRLWRPALGSALADAVEGASQELAEQLAGVLQGRFGVTLGFLAIAGAWAEEALKLEARKLHSMPDNLRAIQPQRQESENGQAS